MSVTHVLTQAVKYASRRLSNVSYCYELIFDHFRGEFRIIWISCYFYSEFTIRKLIDGFHLIFSALIEWNLNSPLNHESMKFSENKLFRSGISKQKNYDVDGWNIPFYKICFPNFMHSIKLHSPLVD